MFNLNILGEVSMIYRRRKYKDGYYVVALDDKGKRVTRKKWSPTDFTLDDAKKVFKKNQTFEEHLQKFRLTNYYEVVDSRPSPRRRRSGKYQYFISGMFKGVEVSGRSDQFPVQFPKKPLVEQAEYRFYSNLSEVAFGKYDEDLGRKVLNVTNKREGFVYYVSV